MPRKQMILSLQYILQDNVNIYYNDNGLVPYNKTNKDEIIKNYKAGKKIFEIIVQGRKKYQINLDTMTQKNMSSNFVRQIVITAI